MPSTTWTLYIYYFPPRNVTSVGLNAYKKHLAHLQCGAFALCVASKLLGSVELINHRPSIGKHVLNRLAMCMMDEDIGYELLADSYLLTFLVTTFTPASDLHPKSLSIKHMASRSRTMLRCDLMMKDLVTAATIEEMLSAA
jgi:hypothetical protein